MNQVFAVYYDNGAMYPEDYERHVVKVFSSRELAEDYAKYARTLIDHDELPYGGPSYNVVVWDVLDSFEKEEPKAPSQAVVEEDDDDPFDQVWLKEDDCEHDPHPDYVIASTSYITNETYLFPADSEGEILNWSEIGGLAERWGCPDWESHEATIKTIETDTIKYEYIRQIGENYHFYKKKKGGQ